LNFWLNFTQTKDDAIAHISGMATNAIEVAPPPKPSESFMKNINTAMIISNPTMLSK
jgi:hypothetical protein